MFSFLYFLAIVFGIEALAVDEGCKSDYGNNYEAVEGYEFGDDEDYDWYCCVRNEVRTYGTCKKVDY